MSVGMTLGFPYIFYTANIFASVPVLAISSGITFALFGYYFARHAYREYPALSMFLDDRAVNIPERVSRDAAAVLSELNRDCLSKVVNWFDRRGMYEQYVYLADSPVWRAEENDFSMYWKGELVQKHAAAGLLRLKAEVAGLAADAVSGKEKMASWAQAECFIDTVEAKEAVLRDEDFREYFAQASADEFAAVCAAAGEVALEIRACPDFAGEESRFVSDCLPVLLHELLNAQDREDVLRTIKNQFILDAAADRLLNGVLKGKKMPV